MSHGKKGLDVVAPHSKFYQGSFGRIYRGLPAWSPNEQSEETLPKFFLDIANEEMIEVPGLTPDIIAQDPAYVADLETRFSSNIPAGYTYFGQFVDHDMTFDPATSLMRQTDPNGLLNHRTPRLDLDSVYGAGPIANPHLYDHTDPDKFLIESIPNTDLSDLPRNSQGRALIGDMRNDENALIAQLQLAFLLAHNTLVDRARELGLSNPFEQARKTLRWLYQYIVWNDFIARIANDAIYRCALIRKETQDGRTKWELGLEDIYNWKRQPFMPVEFSVAAYRFGHSMVRNSYQTNDPHRGERNFAPIFNNRRNGQEDTLHGFRPLRPENYIQWDWFLDMDSSPTPGFPQRARKIDTKLSNALAFLHEEPAGSPMNMLAFRNFLRGYRFQLPSGSDVARKMGYEPIPIEQERDSLWFYILREAESLPGKNRGQMLGCVGSTIVCATIAGLLKGDPSSYYNMEPNWSPDKALLLKETDNIDSDDWTLAAIIRLSGLPVCKEDF